MMNRNEFFQALPVTRLTLRLTSATLEICSDDIDDIHLMVSGGKTDVDALRISASADTLTVEQPMTALAKSAAAPDSWLEIAIRLPRSWKGAINARTVTGWMNIRSVNGSDLDLDTVSGTVMISDVSFLTLSAHAVTGTIKLSRAATGKCSLFSTSGSLTVDSTSLKTGSANTVTGLVSLALSAPFEELSLNSVTGDLCVDAPITACDAILRSVTGRLHTSGVSITEGAARISATTVSSDLDITSTLDPVPEA